MKQSFSKKTHEIFKKYYSIKNTLWDWDIYYKKMAISYLKYIKWIPWIQMVGIWNSVSMKASTDKSDVDLYVVTSNNSMWFVRIMITCIFQFLWVRKNHKNHAGKLCLSFFSTKKWMDFSSWVITDDVYLYFWVLYFQPLLNYNDTYREFLEANSTWADLAGYRSIIEENKKNIIYQKDTACEPSKLIICINKILKKCFLPKTMRRYRHLKQPFGVIIHDDILKFHNHDVRKKVSQKILKNKNKI